MTCSSKTGERQVCPADTAAGVALLRSTGAASCLLGKTWGYDDKPIGVIGGFTYQGPENRDPLLNPDFKTSYMILGGEWLVAPRAKVYTESKIDLDTVSATGASGDSVFTIGFRYDFSWRISHR